MNSVNTLLNMRKYLINFFAILFLIETSICMISIQYYTTYSVVESSSEGTADEGEYTADEGEDIADEGEDTADEGEDTVDEGEGTVDEGEGTVDEGEGTADEGEGTSQVFKNSQEVDNLFDTKLFDYANKDDYAELIISVSQWPDIRYDKNEQITIDKYMRNIFDSKVFNLKNRYDTMDSWIDILKDLHLQNIEGYDFNVEPRHVDSLIYYTFNEGKKLFVEYFRGDNLPLSRMFENRQDATVQLINLTSITNQTELFNIFAKRLCGFMAWKDETVSDIHEKKILFKMMYDMYDKNSEVIHEVCKKLSKEIRVLVDAIFYIHYYINKAKNNDMPKAEEMINFSEIRNGKEASDDDIKNRLFAYSQGASKEGIMNFFQILSSGCELWTNLSKRYVSEDKMDLEDDVFRNADNTKLQRRDFIDNLSKFLHIIVTQDSLPNKTESGLILYATYCMYGANADVLGDAVQHILNRLDTIVSTLLYIQLYKNDLKGILENVKE